MVIDGRSEEGAVGIVESWGTRRGVVTVVNLMRCNTHVSIIRVLAFWKAIENEKMSVYYFPD